MACFFEESIGSTATAVVKHLSRSFSPDDRGYSELNRFRGCTDGRSSNVIFTPPLRTYPILCVLPLVIGIPEANEVGI